jgi:serine/threonine protein kinase
LDNRLLLPPNSMLDCYRIVRVVGAGGFGITYEAEDMGLGASIALKEYYPAEFGDRDARMSIRPKSERHKATFEWGRASFLQEARMLARFSHPAIVRVARVFEANSTAYMVMSFERGQSFEDWLKGLGRPPTQEELDRIAAPLLDALEAMHAVSFLHRDIAPDNIIVRPDGSPVLLDFGAARRAVGEMSRALTGIVKAGYSPQEQYATDSRLQGPWTDLYAFGGTLYRAVTGRPPEEATLRGMEDRMPPASSAAVGNYRPGFLAAIDACLGVKIAERPQSVAALRPMLLAPQADAGLLGTQFNAAAIPGRTQPTGTFATSPPAAVRWALFALLCLGVTYGAIQYVRQPSEDRSRNDAVPGKGQRAEAQPPVTKDSVIRPDDGKAFPFSAYFNDLPAPRAATTPPSSAPSSVPARQPAPRDVGGWLGIRVQSVTDNVADRLSASPGSGALVAAVTPDSPAQKAGLQDGDIVVRFDGRDVADIRDLPPIIRATRVGKPVDITILRAGQRTTIKATIGRSATTAGGPGGQR